MEIYSVDLNELQEENWESIQLDPAIIIDGGSNLRVYRLISSKIDPSRMSIGVVRDDVNAQRAITTAESITYVIKGKGVLEFADRPWIRLKPGVVVSIPKGVKLNWRFETPIELLSIHVANWVPPLGQRPFESQQSIETQRQP